MRLVILIFVLSLAVTPSQAQMTVVDCSKARIVINIEKPPVCSVSRSVAGDGGYGSAVQHNAHGANGRFEYAVAAHFSEGPGGSFRAWSDEQFDRTLRAANEATKKSPKWGPVEQLQGWKVIHFVPAVAKRGACAGVLVNGPSQGVGYAWRYYGYVCEAGVDRVADAIIREAVSRVSVR